MRLSLLLVALALFGSGCDDSCAVALDGSCDELIPGGTGLCAVGTDTTDCRGDGPPEGCSDTCSTARDTQCDDGGEGALYDICELGSDCTDCGSR